MTSVILPRPVPFQHGEFRRMGEGALAVAIDMRDVEDARLARRQQLLAGEFRRGVEIAPLGRAVGLDQLGGEAMQMRLVAGRDLQRAAIHLDEAAVRKPVADGGHDAVPRQEEGAAVGMAAGIEPG